MTPRIVSIAWTPQHLERKPPRQFAREAADRGYMIAGFGLEGDVKGGVEGRHLNIMLADDVRNLQADGYRTAPGELGEQIVIEGIAHLPIGGQLRLGPSAIIAIEEVREPCGRFENVQGFPKERAVNRIGYMATVVASGPIAVGDEVQLL
jgi:MOSC domain-containing protein YiiM